MSNDHTQVRITHFVCRKWHEEIEWTECCVCSVCMFGTFPRKFVPQIHTSRLIVQIHFIFFRLHPDSPTMTSIGSVHPMVTVTPSPLAGPALQPPPKRSAESSPSHSHSHSHSQMSRNSSRKSNNSVNCKIDGKIFHEFNQSVFSTDFFFLDRNAFGVEHFYFLNGERENVLTCLWMCV